MYTLKKIHTARPTVVYSMKENSLGADGRARGLMKYRLGGTISCALFPISSFSTRCGRVRTEESDSYVYCVNGLGQNADCYVNWHDVSSLIGAYGNSHLSVLQNKCTSVAGILFIRPKARITLYCTPVVRPSVSNILCAQLLLQFPSEFDLFEICHTGTQSFRHPVISTPSQFDTFWSLRPILWSIRPTFFFQQMVVSTPFIFLVPNIEPKKNCVFVCTVCFKYFNIIIIIIFAVYSEKYLFADVYVYFFCSTIADTLSS